MQYVRVVKGWNRSRVEATEAGKGMYPMLVRIRVGVEQVRKDWLVVLKSLQCQRIVVQCWAPGKQANSMIWSQLFLDTHTAINYHITAVFIRLLTDYGMSVYRPSVGQAFCQMERIRYPYNGTHITVLYGDGAKPYSKVSQLAWNPWFIWHYTHICQLAGNKESLDEQIPKMTPAGCPDTCVVAGKQR